MSIGGIGSSSLGMLTQQLQSFKSGKSNIQKEELEKIQSQIGGTQNQTTNMFSSLLESFDEVDANEDGLSFEELKDFVDTQGDEGKNGLTGHRKSGSGFFEGLSKGEGLSSSGPDSLKAGMKAGGKPPPSNSEDISSSSFDPLDINQDGKVSMSEIMANIQQEREAFDAQSSSNEVNVIDVFNKFLGNVEKENKSNNLFQSQIEKYSGVSSKSLESRFS